MCSYTFEEATLIIFGVVPKCKLKLGYLNSTTSPNQMYYELWIKLGINNTIKLDMKFLIKPNIYYAGITMPTLNNMNCQNYVGNRFSNNKVI